MVTKEEYGQKFSLESSTEIPLNTDEETSMIATGEEKHVVRSRPKRGKMRLLADCSLSSTSLLAQIVARGEQEVIPSSHAVSPWMESKMEMETTSKFHCSSTKAKPPVPKNSKFPKVTEVQQVQETTGKENVQTVIELSTSGECKLSGENSNSEPTSMTKDVPLKINTRSVSSGLNKKNGGRPRGQSRKQINQAQLRDGVQGKKREKEERPERKKKCSSSESDEEEESDELVADRLTAASLGFPTNHLSEEEIKAGVVPRGSSVQEESGYVEVRNHILASWRDDVNSWLTLDTAKKRLRDKFLETANIAYNFLSTFGHINFGVAPAIKSHIPEESTKATVVVIGAGLAGLAAARQLKTFGHEVVILEARKRPGGRVFTKEMEGQGFLAAADLGGSVLTGIQGNPLGVVARQLGLDMKTIKVDCRLHLPGGLQVEEDMDAAVEKQFNELLDKANTWRKATSELRVSSSMSLGFALDTLLKLDDITMNAKEMQLLDWHFANLEFGNASLLSNLSLANWDQDDAYEIRGDHCFVEGGNVQLVNALAEGLHIIYDTQVEEVVYGADKVVVTAGDKRFEGEFALCTVPLGVLKLEFIKFKPKLPARKRNAIRRLGFGLLNKMALLFPSAFWGKDVDSFGHVTDHTTSRGEYFLFYSYVGVSGSSLLIALVAGKAAITFENEDPVESAAKAVTILREIYEPQGISVPDPLQVVCTRWGKDPFTFGSYSNLAVGSSGKDYDLLAESVGNGRLFFAGEATSRYYPATLHGAFLSGLREAGKIASSAESSGFKSSMKKGVDSDESNASLLVKIFSEPDLEFGCFSFVFDTKSHAGDSTALLKLLLSGHKASPGRDDDLDAPVVCTEEKVQGKTYAIQQAPVHIYTTVMRKQVFDMMEVRGGDTERMRFLTKVMGVELVGRKRLGGTGEKNVDTRLKDFLKT